MIISLIKHLIMETIRVETIVEYLLKDGLIVVAIPPGAIQSVGYGTTVNNTFVCFDMIPVNVTPTTLIGEVGATIEEIERSEGLMRSIATNTQTP